MKLEVAIQFNYKSTIYEYKHDRDPVESLWCYILALFPVVLAGGDGLSRWWCVLALFPGASSGRKAFEFGVLAEHAVVPRCVGRRRWFESLVVHADVVPPSHRPDERRLNRWWCVLVLFPVASSGREVFESLVVGVVPRRDGRTRGV
ncbi:MAG: hypothetical protein HQM06_16195 [Magnetococcales bacterium]|nr:hypothetical protein [Magnetococcales bacterium]